MFCRNTDEQSTGGKDHEHLMFDNGHVYTAAGVGPIQAQATQQRPQLAVVLDAM